MSNLTKNTVRVFEDCPNIVGGAGTQWTSSKKTAEYAHVDGGPDNPGYLTEYKLVPYAVVKRSTRPHYYWGDIEYGEAAGYDTLTIKYGFPEENAFEIVCDGKNWWKNDKDTFVYFSTSINIDPSFSKYPIKTTANMFKGCWRLEEVNGLKYINTDSVTDMSGMFAECNDIVKLDLEGFKTPNVTKMDSMFFQVGFSNNYSEPNYLRYGDDNYGSYVDLNLADFNTQNVTSMESMFSCARVHALDISSFDTRKVTNMKEMLYGCAVDGAYNISVLKKIYVGENWSVEAVENKQEIIFNGAVGCAGTDGSARRVFSDCELAKVDGGFENPGLLSSHKELNKFPELYALLFESGKVGIYYGNAPKNAYKPKIYSDKDGVRCYWERDKENLNEKTVLTISIDSSVANCRPRILNGLFSFDALNSIEGLEYFITDSVKDMGYMFAGSQLNTIDLRSFYTSSLKNTYKMFSDCSELKTIYVGDGWAVEGLSGNGMFAGCSNLVGGAGTKWTGSKTSAVYARIDGGEENPGYFTKAKIDTFIIDGLKYIITDRMHVSVGWESSTEDTIVIPEKVQIDGTDYTVTGIMDEGFINQFKLKSVVIPESVTKIGEKAFYENHNIISLDIPSSVSSIGASAFTTILNVAYAGNAEGGPWGANVLNGEVDYDLKYVFSDSTRTKIVRCFGHDSIIVIPNTVKELGRNSFAKIIELKSVDLNNVEKIDDKAFTYTGLQEISLSNKIKYIGER
ncbi:MAG: BspA family leucine-rich repeat surface protein, partial [Bacteroidales bacterium]|nr:BspA family leucine-rich repeat surface protein [Bacteroidales bacterium]